MHFAVDRLRGIQSIKATLAEIVDGHLNVLMPLPQAAQHHLHHLLGKGQVIWGKNSGIKNQTQGRSRAEANLPTTSGLSVYRSC